MNVLWVILNEDKNAIVETFETIEADSKPHWDKFLQHRPGVSFCCRESDSIFGRREKKWYYNYFYWQDMSLWGCGKPDGVAWSACMAVPEILKMVEFVL